MKRLFLILLASLGVMGCAPSSEQVEIVGLVAPGGTGASKVGPETSWSFMITMNHWKSPDGELQEGTLFTSLEIDGDKSQYWYDLVPEGSIIRISGNWNNEFDDEYHRLDLIDFKGIEKDVDLEAIAAELEKPVYYQDDHLGKLELDRRLDWFHGVAPWIQSEVNISVNTAPGNGDEIDKKALAHLALIFKDPESWERRFKDFAAESLLELKNDNWLGEDESEFTVGDFKSKMTIASLQAYADGSFEVFYDDGNLFWGHVIIVSGTLKDGPTDANIAG